MNLKEKLKSLTSTEISDLCSERVFARAEEYSSKEYISNIRLDDNVISASVQGSEYRPYQVKIKYDSESDEFIPSCNCPFDMEEFCKHTIAVLLYLNEYSPKKSDEVEEISEDEVISFIDNLPQEKLIELLKNYAGQFDEIREDITLKLSKQKGQNIKTDKFIKEINKCLPSNHFIDYYGMSSFVSELEEIQTSIKKLISSGFSKEAAEIFEHFIKKSIPFYENTDDSDGFFGDFIHSLLDGHAQSLSLFSCDQKSLADWIWHHFTENDYGFGDNIIETYHNILQKDGLEFLKQKAQERLEDFKKKLESSNKSDKNDDWEVRYGYSSSREFLLRIFDLSGDDKSFFELAEKDLQSSDDYLILIKKLIYQNRIDKAISRGEEACKKLKDKVDYDLFEVIRELYRKTSQPEKELDTLEKLFKLRPERKLLREIETLSKRLNRWQDSREKVINILQNHGDTDFLAEIYIAENNFDTLINLAQSKSSQISTKEKIAKTISDKFPNKTIEVYKEIIPLIIDEKNNHAYRHAANLLKELRKVYEKIKGELKWKGYFEKIKTQHKLKRNFMAEIAKVERS